MADNRAESREEWRLHWPLLLAATVGISFCAVPSVTLGLFMQPLQAEFGWSRTTISLGMAVYALSCMVLSPFAGALVDRFGSRAAAIPGLALCGLLFSGFSLMSGVVAMWIVLWVAYSLASQLIRMVVWNPAVSSAFVINRGIAIAILLSGMSIASAIAPLLTNWLIETFGWRGAYIGLGIGWTGLSLLLVIPFLKLRKKPESLSDQSIGEETAKPTPGGLNFRDALRSIAIMRIAATCLLVSTLTAAWGVHMVPIYVSLGVERVIAASMAVIVAVASVVSKLAVGSIADRINSRFLPFFAMAIPAGGYGLLLSSGGEIAFLIGGALLIGCGSGASLHMVMYLTTQYGGLRNFGKIYGSVSALSGLAAGIGPVMAAMIFDMTGNYELFLMAGIPVFILAGLLVFGLGPFPNFQSTQAKSSPA